MWSIDPCLSRIEDSLSLYLPSLSLYFVGFYSVSNLIVILFNIMYLVFVVGIYSYGCVIVWESVKTQVIEARKVFAGILRQHPAKRCMCPTHDWNAKSQYRWRQLCLVSISRVRPSRETPARHSVLPDCTIWYTPFAPTLYIPTLPTNDIKSFREKTLAKTLES